MTIVTTSVKRRPMHRVPSFTAERCRVIAVDGEGNDIDGRHSYTLLAAADDRGQVRRYIEHNGTRREAEPGVTQPNYGLPTKRCLDFLLDLVKSPSDLVVAFSFNYDAMKIISDLPLTNLMELVGYDLDRNKLPTEERTTWQGYEIRYRPGKYFSVAQPRFGKVRGPDGITRYRRHVKVWDAFGYFQQSFVSALKATGKGVFTTEERDLIPVIEAMKAQRSQFEDLDANKILDYCFSEVTLLAKMMRDVIVNTEIMDLYPSEFHGASAIASYWMRSRARIPSYIRSPEDLGIPDEVVNGGYYGGRFENSVVGEVGTGYAYDIRSAYPSVMQHLPCLAHATTRRVTQFEPGKWGVYLVGSETAGPYAPFPIRLPKEAVDKHQPAVPPGMSKWFRKLYKQQVVFAHGGRRWVWQSEVETARKHFGEAAIPVYDGYVLDLNCDHKPFSAVAGLYDERLLLKAAGDGRQMVLKLLINSLYGKTAQSLGHKIRKDTPYEVGDPRRYEPPDTLCRIWSGMITSGTRAQVLDAIMTSGNVVSIATDGIISTQPIPELDDLLTKKLGDWEYDEYRDVVIYQSGIYAFEVYDGKEWKQKLKSRGFSPRDVTRDMLREAWQKGLTDVYPRGCIDKDGNDLTEGLASAKIASPKEGARNFVGLRASMARKGAETKLDMMGQWVMPSRPVTFVPGKRELDLTALFGYSEDRPSLMPTKPHTIGNDLEGLPYVPHESWEDIAEMEGWVGAEAEDDDLPMMLF